MARKLPWSATEAQDEGKGRERSVASNALDNNAASVIKEETSEQTPHRNRKRVEARSPSTSPIRLPSEPVPSIEFMREGFHADDRFMMVEDEFEAVARQFTAHLHAAEYARLKRKAKEAPPRALPDISSNMSRTTKQSLERRHLLSRQSTALSNLGSRRGGAGGSDGDSSDEEEEGLDQRDKKVDDPWLGTSLAGLMEEGSQARTSLMGLERMNSSTRAARGYGKGETESSSTPSKKQKTILDIFSEADRDEKNNDMIETPPRIGSRHIKTQVSHPAKPTDTTTTTTPVKSDPDPMPRLPPPRRHQQTHPTRTPTSRRTRIQNLDDFDASKFEDPPPLLPPPPQSSSSPARGRGSTGVRKHNGGGREKEKKKEDRKARLDEVPVFLA